MKIQDLIKVFSTMDELLELLGSLFAWKVLEIKKFKDTDFLYIGNEKDDNYIRVDSRDLEKWLVDFYEHILVIYE